MLSYNVWPVPHASDIPYFSTQDDLAIMIEGTDGQYYLQAGAILLPGPSLSCGSFSLTSFYYFLAVCDTRTQASGVSKTKLAFHWTQSTHPATYQTVCVLFLLPVPPIPYTYTPSSIAVADKILPLLIT